MRKFNVVIQTDSEESARQKALEWFSELPNLTVDKVLPYKHGGYQVWISYNQEDSK